MIWNAAERALLITSVPVIMFPWRMYLRKPRSFWTLSLPIYFYKFRVAGAKKKEVLVCIMDFDKIIMNRNENSTFRQRGREHSPEIIALMKISIALYDIDNSLPPWSSTRKPGGRRWTQPKQHYHWEWWHQRLQRTESQRTDLPQFPPRSLFLSKKPLETHTSQGISFTGLTSH